jgi:hypothetical protein
MNCAPARPGAGPDAARHAGDADDNVAVEVHSEIAQRRGRTPARAPRGPVPAVCCPAWFPYTRGTLVLSCGANGILYLPGKPACRACSKMGSVRVGPFICLSGCLLIVACVCV